MNTSFSKFKKLLLSLSYLILGLPFLTHAQYAQEFRQFEFENSDFNFPTSIAQDSLGFIWIGTVAGLFRYDGFELKGYYNDPEAPNSLPQNFIDNLYLDSHNRLWIMHRPKGLSLYDLETNQFYSFPISEDGKPGMTNELIKSVVEDDQGGVWIAGSKSLDYYPNFQLDSINKFPISITHNPEDPFSLTKGLNYHVHEDRFGNIWIGNRNGINRYDPKTKKFINHRNNPKYFPDSCRYVFEDSQGNLYALFSYRSTFYKWIPEVDSFQAMPNAQFNGSNEFYAACDQDNICWIVENGFGLHRYDLRTQSSDFFPSDKRNLIGVKGDFIERPLIDIHGNFWLTGTIKLQLLPRTYKSIINVPLTYNNQNRINSINLTDEFILIGQVYGGLIHFDLKKRKAYRFTANPNHPDSLFNNRVGTITQKKDGNFLVGDRNGVLEYDPQNKKLKRLFKRPTGLIRCAYQDSKGRIWLLWTGGHIGIYDENTGKYQRVLEELNEFFPSISFVEIIEDKKGNLWIGTNTIGIFQIDPDLNLIDRWFEDYSFLDIQILNDSILIGSSTKGLVHLNLNDYSSTIINEQIGLSDNNTRQTVIDDKGNIWAVTAFGLNKINLRDTTINHYFKSDGFINNYYNVAAQSPSGLIALGGQQGLSYFYPNEFSQHPLPPKLVFTNLNVLNQPYPLPKPIQYTKRIDLNYNENFIEFQFAALHFAAPQKNEYAYKMEGLRDEWINIKNQRTLSFTALDPGKYTLHLKASNSDKIWMEDPISIDIHIHPAWWQTIWFKILVGVMIATASFLIYSTRLRSIQKEAEFKQRIQKLKMEALRAQMNPHFLFNSLNSIKSYIGQHDPKTATKYLTEFSQLIRQVLQNGQHEMIRLNDELEAVKHYLNLEQFRFKDAFSYEINIGEGVNEDFIEIPPLIFQPYIENAIWHGLMHKESPDRYLKININREEDLIIIEIEDNGIGRELSQQLKTRSASKHQSLGMKITKDRVSNLQETYGKAANVAIIDLYNDEGKALGTRVVIKLPIPD